MIVTGSPVQAFIDAVRTVLIADPTLDGLVEGVFGHLSEAQRTAYPYVVLGRRHRANDSGAMQVAGGHVTVQLDVWSDHKGPSEAHAICSRVTALLERRMVTVSGFEMVNGSLTCDFEEVFDEPDEDSPDRRLYHGVMLWGAEIHETR